MSADFAFATIAAFARIRALTDEDPRANILRAAFNQCSRSEDTDALLNAIEQSYSEPPTDDP